MNILNVITYTTPGPAGSDYLMEHTTQLSRPYRLTTKGAERILRAANPEVVSVSRVETFMDKR